MRKIAQILGGCLWSFGIIVSVLAVSCKPSNEKEPISEPLAINKIVFKVDERTEFFRTLFNLAVQEVVPKEMSPCQTPYLEKVNAYFAPYKEHPLMQYIYDHETMGVDISTIGLMYKDLESFEIDTIYKKEFPAYGMSWEEMEAIKPMLKDFYEVSNFNAFYKSHTNYYQEVIQKLQEQTDAENLIQTIIDFYQSNRHGLELHVFIELTNNANNKALSFYDAYNPNKRAIILANICEDVEAPTAKNTQLELDVNLRTRLFHESSHLFTDALLNKYIGDLEQYKSLCDPCDPVAIKDKVDHLIVYPIQESIAYKTLGKDNGHTFYTTRCTDVRNRIYEAIDAYDPKAGIPFETTYATCIALIQEAAKAE